MASIFTKIIQGAIPCFKVYENEHVLAFLDIHPIHPGHTLIVPKIEVDHFLDVPEPYYSAVFQAAKPVGQAIYTATGSKRVGTQIVGWDVPHFHLHVLPLWGSGDFDFRSAKSASKEELQLMQQKILSCMKN